jgi:hypothetical protein
MNLVANVPLARSVLDNVKTGVCAWAPLLPHPEMDAAETASATDNARILYFLDFMVRSLLQ